MMKILDPIRILETIEKLGARKSIKYAFIGTGCILVVVVPICYAITSVKSRGKSKEQNNASANKQGKLSVLLNVRYGEGSDPRPSYGGKCTSSRTSYGRD